MICLSKKSKFTEIHWSRMFTEVKICELQCDVVINILDMDLTRIFKFNFIPYQLCCGCFLQCQQFHLSFVILSPLLHTAQNVNICFGPVSVLPSSLEADSSGREPFLIQQDVTVERSFTAFDTS